MIALHCEQIIPKTIMRFNKVKDAQNYVIDILERETARIEAAERDNNGQNEN